MLKNMKTAKIISKSDYGEFFEGDDTALKTEAGQPILVGRAIADLVIYLQGIQK